MQKQNKYTAELKIDGIKLSSRTQSGSDDVKKRDHVYSSWFCLAKTMSLN
jgi:hypothetical protein